MDTKILSELQPAGLELFSGIENLLHELAEDDELLITGGQRNLSTSIRGRRRLVVRRRRPRVVRRRRNTSTD